MEGGLGARASPAPLLHLNLALLNRGCEATRPVSHKVRLSMVRALEEAVATLLGRPGTKGGKDDTGGESRLLCLFHSLSFRQSWTVCDSDKLALSPGQTALCVTHKSSSVPKKPNRDVIRVR